MGIVFLEKGAAHTFQQYQEIHRHVQVVRHHRSGNQGPFRVEGIGQGHEIDPASDVGPSHHGRHLGQPVDPAPQKPAAQHGSAHGPHRPDEENEQQPAGFLPDLRQVGLEQQQRNGQGYGVSPDDIVINGGMAGDHVQVHQHNGRHQSQYGPGDPGGPGIGLFQPDGACHHPAGQGQQQPGVFRCNQWIHKQHPSLFVIPERRSGPPDPRASRYSFALTNDMMSLL